MRSDEIFGPLSSVHFLSRDYFGFNLFILELLFWVAVIVLTWVLVRLRPALLEKAEARLRVVSQYRRFWLVGFGLLVIVTRLSLLPLLPVPIPAVQDEFSYLLASDTFSHGRLTNPPNAMWQHFESFHINMQPTYQSMYPPAQGLSLALGQKVFGLPWAGVLLVTALLCSAMYWMLLGWLPAPWAWLGGALAFVRFGIFSYWMDSYFGGSLAALGGVLVLGALPRFHRKPGVRIGLVMAVGLLILANTRPLEGFLFSLPILAMAVLILLQQAKTNWRAALKVALPAVALLAAGAAGMLYYNWRGTGNALVMPYAINWSTYHITSPFLFMKVNEVPHYRHEAMRAYYLIHEVPPLIAARNNPIGLVQNTVIDYYEFFLWPFLILIVPCLRAMWRSPLRIVVVSLGLVAVELLAQLWQPWPHYAAPATGAIFLALLFSVRHFRGSRSEYGVWGARAVALVFAVVMIFPIADKLYDPYSIGGFEFASQQHGDLIPLAIQRSRIESRLEARGGQHLIIVRYPFRVFPSVDWIYNRADIDHASVIWARDMGYEKNKELVSYYRGRQIWYATYGDPTGEIFPYDQAMSGLQMAYDGAPDEIPPATNSKRSPQVAYATKTDVTARPAKQELSAGASQ